MACPCVLYSFYLPLPRQTVVNRKYFFPCLRIFFNFCNEQVRDTNLNVIPRETHIMQGGNHTDHMRDTTEPLLMDAKKKKWTEKGYITVDLDGV